LRKHIEADGPLSKVLKEVFLQGSYRQDTAIRPTNSTQFDVDVVLALDARAPRGLLELLERRDPDDVLGWVASRLRTIPGYAGKVHQKKRCVCVEYENEFHMDIVPAHAPDGADHGVLVPDRKRESWIRSNPKGYMAWCTQRNKATNGRFVRVTKYLKAWRDQSVAQAARPKSIILQSLIGRACPEQDCADAAATVATLRAVHKVYSEATAWWSAPTVKNPVLDDENLAAGLTYDEAKRFEGELKVALGKAEAAYAEPNSQRSALLWQGLFGTRFPLS
jgi:hypothetical protein